MSEGTNWIMKKSILLACGATLLAPYLLCTAVESQESSSNTKTRENLLGKVPVVPDWSNVVVSADSKHIAVPAVHGGKRALSLDGIEGDLYDKIHSVVFSMDGKRWAFVGQKGPQQEVLVVDGKETRTFESGVIAPGSVLFSPDAQHLAFCASIVVPAYSDGFRTAIRF